MVSPRHETKLKQKNVMGITIFSWVNFTKPARTGPLVASVRCSPLTPTGQITNYKLQIEEIGYHPQGSWHDALCSQKPGEDIGSPGGVVTGASEAPSIGNAN